MKHFLVTVINQESALAIFRKKKTKLKNMLCFKYTEWCVMETKLELNLYCDFLLYFKFVMRFCFFSVFCDHVHAFLNKMWSIEGPVVTTRKSLISPIVVFNDKNSNLAQILGMTSL